MRRRRTSTRPRLSPLQPGRTRRRRTRLLAPLILVAAVLLALAIAALPH